MIMREADLIPGDIIFFENNYKDAEMQHSYDYVDHVAIFDGFNAEGTPMLIHAIANKMGYYYPEKASGLCKTTLRELKHQLQQEAGHEDCHYDVTYKVFRFENEVITQKALHIMQNQARYRIPYDDKRLNEKLAREDDDTNPLDDNGFKELGMARYRSAGIYRSIKYAARHRTMLTRTKNDGIGRGLTCSMAVILAFQIAELLVDNKVRAYTCDAWPSDKHAQRRPDQLYPEAYLNYLNALRADSSPRSIIEPYLMLSYDFWKDKHQPPEQYTHTSMAVDSKVIGAGGLFAYLLEHSAWEYHGVLQAEARRFTPIQQANNRAQNRDMFFQSLTHVREQITVSPVTVSPASSTDPARLSIVSDEQMSSQADDLDGVDWVYNCIS